MTTRPKTIRRRIAPANCGFDELSRISRDHFDVGDWSIMTDSSVVWLTKQKLGERPSLEMEIPAKTFGRLIKWYLRPQVMIAHPEPLFKIVPANRTKKAKP